MNRAVFVKGCSEKFLGKKRFHAEKHLGNPGY